MVDTNPHITSSEIKLTQPVDSCATTLKGQASWYINRYSTEGGTKAASLI